MTASFCEDVCLAAELVRIKERLLPLGPCFKEEDKELIGKEDVEMFSSSSAVCPLGSACL